MLENTSNLFSFTAKYTYYIIKLVWKSLYNIIYNLLLIHRNKYMVETLFLFLLAFSLLLGTILGVVIFKVYDLSDIEALDKYGLYEIPSVVYDRQNKPFKVFATHQRDIINYEEIPETIINTLLTAEDRDFFKHKGINPFGILRAMIVNLLEGRVAQGGSTLTQQLSKLLFTNRERSIKRKLKELIYSLQIEKKFTKEEILEKYLNKVYYANGVYSISSACKFYFGIPISEINYAQAALLVSIPPNPTFYNPLIHPINVKNRQNAIMHSLIELGYISQDDAERETANMWDSIQTKLLDGTYYSNRQKNLDLAPYFSEYIRRILFSQYGDGLYTQGYKIYTTIDIDLQQAAEKSIKEHILLARKDYQEQAKDYYKAIQNKLTSFNPAHPFVTEFLGVSLGMPNLQFSIGQVIEKTRQHLVNNKDLQSLDLVFSIFGMHGMKKLIDNAIIKSSDISISLNELEGSLISTEANTGRILAMVGGSQFSSSNQINRVYQTRRQPGSTFKPLVYLSALSTGRFTAASTFNDSPIVFQLPDGSIWTPGNSGRNYESETTLRNALRKSINIISVKLLQAMGISQSIDFISNLLSLDKSRFRFDSSLALGTSELSPLELNKAYNIIASGGKDIIPHGLIMVKNRYNQILQTPEDDILNIPTKQLVDLRYNYIITTMMQDIFRRGTATTMAKAMNFPTNDIAGKTGTASNMSDAWFSGFTSRVATTVWVGFDQRTTLGKNGFGAVLAEPIWIDYMKEVLKKYPTTPFIKPDGVIATTIHKDNGLLMPSYCTSNPQAILEYFTEETIPTQVSPYCDSKLEVDIQQNTQTIDTKDIFASSL